MHNSFPLKYIDYSVYCTIVSDGVVIVTEFQAGKGGGNCRKLNIVKLQFGLRPMHLTFIVTPTFFLFKRHRTKKLLVSNNLQKIYYWLIE